MTKEFFEQQVERLRRVYSPTSLNQERMVVLWERFFTVSNGQFEKAVNHLIGEYTTQALPALSKFSEAVAMFRPSRGVGEQLDEAPIDHFCEACRDFGYGFVGDTLVRCSCENGRTVSPAEIAKQQGHYDRGGAFLKRGGMKAGFLPELPYARNDRSDA